MHAPNELATYSNNYYYEDEYDANPTHLLSLAIKKRRSLMESRDGNMRMEIQLTGMIKSLCKFLGEDRAKRRNRQNRRNRSRSRSQSRKRRWDSLEPISKKDINESVSCISESSKINDIENSPSTVQVVPQSLEPNIQSSANEEDLSYDLDLSMGTQNEAMVKQAKLDNNIGLSHFNDDLSANDPLGLDDLFSCFKQPMKKGKVISF